MQATSTIDAAGDVFTALAHPTRRQILQDLKDGELAAGEIAARFSATGPTISRHLSVLRVAGLVTERRDANRILYSLAGDRLALSVGDFLSTVCPEQMVLRSIRPAARPAVQAAGGESAGSTKKSAKKAARKSAKKADR
ncbi:metalloregulator ArsR/SmtB family transcription factor [Cryobacterium sp. SO2]|uniref:metalloregulator ArsR/SmtB family transcription factor n=1 Tax=Cryobacterium sp. SO2 TaxID=1897060 RepID=UPI00223CA374|nr:metalloregulator ArsR/SmtB family transcription factor [Cryobacterium sp. SO2]WEO75798.1 metalloregulator ArsR/SmtB family transcription factor [Cryobacterium sp. SO2]